MADTPTSELSPIEQASAAHAQVQVHLQKLHKQQRELQTLIRQIEAEVQPLTTRKSERADLVRAIEANPTSYPPTNIREAYEALSDATLRLYLMQTQLESLRQREQWLGAQQVTLREYATTFDQLSQSLAATPAPSPVAQPADGLVEEEPASTELARQYVAAREEQSHWLAQHLQEGPVQALTNLVLQAEVSHRMLAKDPKKASGEIQTLKATLARVLGDARYFVAELHPPALSDMGLRSTLRRYIAELAARSGREISVELPGQDAQLSAEVEVALFRIAQEGLALALVATADTPMRVSIETAANSVEMSMEAPGTAKEGFDPSPARQRIALYAQSIGAELEIRMTPERFALALSLPLES